MFHPINKYVQVKPIDILETSSGIMLDPNTLKRKQEEQAHLVKCLSIAHDVSVIVQPGDILLVDKQMIEDFTCEGKKVSIIKEQHIKGILRGQE